MSIIEILVELEQLGANHIEEDGISKKLPLILKFVARGQKVLYTLGIETLIKLKHPRSDHYACH